MTCCSGLNSALNGAQNSGQGLFVESNLSEAEFCKSSLIAEL